ncbi:MAG: hypothetical protein IKB01_05735, partial [Lachnospiraceae bacterium]|nr:hypothetical protein [Lachnospiraceae bacterium]
MKKKLIKKFIILFAVIVLFTPAKANAEKIDIAKDIAGFKYYLCDDDLIIEWTESINGYVSITAMYTVTTEIFYKDNIKTNQSIIPIKGISEVYVTVESRNYNTIQFLTSTIYQPSGTVVFNTPSQTNKENAECSVILDDSYFIEIYLEDKLVEKTDLYEIGEYEFNIPISAGNNYITAYIVDVKGNKKSYSTIISRDIAAPVLNLTKDYDMVSTTDDVINISGSVYDYKVLTINGVQINVEENGNFSFDYSLLDGNNNIVIIALDNVGNVAEYSATVSKVAQIEKENNTWMTVAIIVIFVVAVLCVLYKKNIIKISAFRRGDNDEENSIGTEIVDEQEEDVDERVQNGHINQDKSNT